MGRILALDIETVPQKRWLELDADNDFLLIDQNWVEEESGFARYGRDTTTLNRFCENRLPGLIAQGSYKLAATGTWPAAHASTCHIVSCAFGWFADNGVIVTDVPSLDCDPNAIALLEPDLIVKILERLNGAVAKGTRIVTFNGKGFDLSVVRVRGMIARIVPTMSVPWGRLFYPYSDDQHCDLRSVLGNRERYAKGTAAWWGEAFGIEAKEHGGDVRQWVRDGRWDLVHEYGDDEARWLCEMFRVAEPYLDQPKGSYGAY